MFDDTSFDTKSYDERSWYFGIVRTTVRFVVRMISVVSTRVNFKSRV